MPFAGHFRRAAALAASLSLLAMPVRAVLACDMGATLHDEATQAEAIGTGDAAVGAHHDHTAMREMRQSSRGAAEGFTTSDAPTMSDAQTMSDAPTTSDAPATPERPAPQCDHLVGCAPVALGTNGTSMSALPALHRSVTASASRAIEAPVQSLEPPPPRA